MFEEEYEKLTIIIIIIITLLYLLIRYKKNRENFNDIKDDILTSTNEKPLEIDTLTILNNLNTKNLIINKDCKNNINESNFTNTNLNNIIVDNINYKNNKTTILNNNGFIYLNDNTNNIKNLNTKQNLTLNGFCYNLNNIKCNDLEVNRKDNEFIDNIELLNAPKQIKYNKVTLYPTDIEILDGLSKKTKKGLKWKK